MGKILRKIAFLIIIAIVIGFSASVNAEGIITLNKTELTLEVGNTETLTYTGATEGSTITWESDDPTTATVDSNGLVTAIKEGTATIKVKETFENGTYYISSCTVKTLQWSDFSNAKLKLKSDSNSSILEISGAEESGNGHYYSLFITADNNKPNVTSESPEKMPLLYNNEQNIFKSGDLDEYIEKNQDLYISILESKGSGVESIVFYGQKIERLTEPKYSDAFYATMITHDADQIIMNFTHSGKNNRKMQIKVGKIANTSILNKIKNQDSSGFADLLSYAKSNSGIYDEKLNAKEDYPQIGYIVSNINNTNGNALIDLKGLEDDAYYYLYVKTDDENGKYISNEAVTLAQADVYTSGGWYMFFYGSSDFKWADFGNITPSPSSSNNKSTGKPSTLPYTGIASTTLVLIIIVTSGAVFFKMKKDKYKGI